MDDEVDGLLEAFNKRLRDTLARTTSTTPPVFEPGDLVGNRFRIVCLLGKGGMGEVYEAEDLVLHDIVALKTLPQTSAGEERAIERLKREIALARRITHPNVCRVFDADEHQPPMGQPIVFFTMERLVGETLSTRLGRRGSMTREEALPLIRQLASALGAVHTAGIVHGDLKPGNIVLVPASSDSGGTPAGDRLVVTDFGLAHRAPTASVSAGSMHLGWGTPEYMAPEQLSRRPATPQSDVYAMGLVVTEMADSDTVVEWREAIDRCLERDPSLRFRTPDEFVRALETSKPGSRRARLWTAAAAAAAVVAIASATAWRIMHRTPAVAPAPAETVALLPFDDADRSADGAAFGRGLAVTLTEQLHLASVLDPAVRVQALPTGEVLEGDLRTSDSARRSLGASVIVTGRVEHNPAARTIDVVVKTGDTTKVLRSWSRDRPVLPAAAASLADLLKLPLSAATLRQLSEGGTQSAEAEWLYLQGRGYLTRGDAAVDQAIDTLRRAKRADQAFAMAVAALADAYRQKYIRLRDPSFISLAQAEADDAIRLKPDVSYAHVVRGNIYFETGQHERAIREFQDALTTDPAALNARRRLAEAYDAQGLEREAEDNYRKEIASYPRHWSPLIDLASFLIRHGRYAEAESHLLTAAQNAPDNVRVIGNLAGLYILTERFAAAEAELRRGLKFEVNAIGLNNLAWVFIYQGQLEKAVPMLEQAVKAPGADSMHWANLARVYRWTNRPDKAHATYDAAIRLARTAVSLNPRNARIRANLASLLAETGQQGEALVEMATTLERAPTDVAALFRSSIVHELAGDRAGALQALEAAARGGHSAVEIRRYPDLARLRQDPRFLNIVSLAAQPGVQ